MTIGGFKMITATVHLFEALRQCCNGLRHQVNVTFLYHCYCIGNLTPAMTAVSNFANRDLDTTTPDEVLLASHHLKHT